MDPVSVTSLVAGSIGVADVTVKLGCGLRHLQQEFSGALEHVDNIAQQTGTIDFAIREICSLLRSSPNAFPPSFDLRLQESTSAIDRVVCQIQDHTKSVKDKAEKSPTKGKLLHLRHTDKILQWENNLSVQIQALTLLLHVAQLRSNDERTSVLEQDSSKRLFEKASSVSARIGKSSRTPSSARPCSSDIKSFPFDATLLKTKVYRKACEWLWRREVTISGEDFDENDSTTSTSVSSNDAIASHSGESIIRASLGAEEGSSGEPSSRVIEMNIYPSKETSSPKVPKANLLEDEEHQKIFSGPPQSALEESTNCTTQVTTNSSYMDSTGTTLRTTISSLAPSKMADQALPRGRSNLGQSVVLVEVDTIGSDHIDLPDRNIPNYYIVINDTISQLRDRILAVGGIEPSTYRGSLTACTIETSGNSIDKFQFTTAFLGAALEKVDEGFYTRIEIIARFSTPTATNSSHLAAQIVTSQDKSPTIECNEKDLTIESKQRSDPHSHLVTNDRLPFFDQAPVAKGGFGNVYKAQIHPDQRQMFWDSDRTEGYSLSDDTSPLVAVKELKSDDEEDFKREADILKRLTTNSAHPHVVRLLATCRSGGKYYLLFPWADGNLREFWKQERRLDWDPTSQMSNNRSHAIWMIQQCAGIADGLRNIHKELNQPVVGECRYGRHGDLKPENILYFKDEDSDRNSPGILQIADFGLGRFHGRDTRSGVKDVAKRFCTPTYRAPECDSPGRMSSAYDIWSLGCLFLEFVTWVLLGYDEVKRFSIVRRAHGQDDAFFGKDADGRHRINPWVTQQLQKLRIKASGFESPLDETLKTFLAVIVSCLEVNGDKRLPAEIVAKQCKEMYTRLSILQPSKKVSNGLGKNDTAVSSGVGLG